MSKRTVIPTFVGVAGFAVTLIELRLPMSESWPVPLLIACAVGGLAANAARIWFFAP